MELTWFGLSFARFQILVHRAPKTPGLLSVADQQRNRKVMPKLIGYGSHHLRMLGTCLTCRPKLSAKCQDRQNEGATTSATRRRHGRVPGRCYLFSLRGAKEAVYRQNEEASRELRVYIIRVRGPAQRSQGPSSRRPAGSWSGQPVAAVSIGHGLSARDIGILYKRKNPGKPGFCRCLSIARKC